MASYGLRGVSYLFLGRQGPSLSRLPYVAIKLNITIIATFPSRLITSTFGTGLIPIFYKMNEQEQLKPQNKDHSHSEDSQGQGSYTDSISQSPSEVVAEGQGGQKKQNLHKKCCKICKHPDKSKKACVCVVPLSQRRASLGDGCRNCGCLGCSKEDFLSKGEDPQYHPDLNSQKTAKQQAQPKRSERRQRRDRSRSHKRKASPARKKARKQTPSRSRSPQIIDSFSMKFHNFDRSIIGTMLINDCGVNPNLLGFAIPQRSYSYLFGKPR